VDAEESVDLDPSARFFPRFPKSPLLRALVLLEVARRQRPIPAARVDCPAREQNARFPEGHGPHHDLRILVVDEAAIGADQAFAVVPFGDAAHERSERIDGCGTVGHMKRMARRAVGRNMAQILMSVADDMSGFRSTRSVRFGVAGGIGCYRRSEWLGLSRRSGAIGAGG